MSTIIRELQASDLPAAIALWTATEGIGLTPDETPEMLARYLQRNVGISSAAIVKDRLAGAVLGGHDGRRGFVYHLAVDAACRGQGIGRRLVDRTLAQLAALGLLKAAIMVYATNAEGRAFWEHLGWNERVDLRPLQITL